jgi:glyceraldehyde 3-phosphate dehydrogenase
VSPSGPGRGRILTDLTVVLNREVTAVDVNRAFEEAAGSSLSGVLRYSTDPLVSRDIIGDPRPACSILA